MPAQPGQGRLVTEPSFVTVPIAPRVTKAYRSASSGAKALSKSAWRSVTSVTVPSAPTTATRLSWSATIANSGAPSARSGSSLAGGALSSPVQAAMPRRARAIPTAIARQRGRITLSRMAHARPPG